MNTAFEENWFKKTWWKYTNRKMYLQYKQDLLQYRQHKPIIDFITQDRSLTVNDILNMVNRGHGEINVSHSGNAGDIIYSLPVIKKLYELTSTPVNFLLKLDEPLELAPGTSHPLNNVKLNLSMANGLINLLDSQPYINRTFVYEGQQVHLDLSVFRKSGVDLSRGNIARWNFYTTGIYADLSESWLEVEAMNGFADTIVLARSTRYNNPLIDYSFLSAYKDVVFVGVKSEYERMKKFISGLQWHPVNDFLELAQVIKGSGLFIGNQSFPFSVAEALKVVRILEVCPLTPNVIPEGPNAYDFYFQKHFEYLVDSLVTTGTEYCDSLAS
jgi:hypothetical protein